LGPCDNLSSEDIVKDIQKLKSPLVIEACSYIRGEVSRYAARDPTSLTSSSLQLQ
ncbi:13094_t:CDS:2, partial [Dentiscutata heterogama]